MNCDWLFDMSVKRPHGRVLANQSCHGFQTFSRQSEALATRDNAFSKVDTRSPREAAHNKLSNERKLNSEMLMFEY